jgi:hypothetical protein
MRGIGGNLQERKKNLQQKPLGAKKVEVLSISDSVKSE